jgi:hypothetical protein
MTMLYLHTKFYLYNYHAVLVTAGETEILIWRGHRLFYFQQKKYRKNVHILFLNLPLYKLSKLFSTSEFLTTALLHCWFAAKCELQWSVGL